LDVYVPPDRTDFPVVFLVFGGMYRNGEKSRQAYLAQTFAREGYGVVAINHRISDGSLQQVVFPGHEVDVARAFAWTYRHIAEYGGDPSKIVLLGHSSGAMLVSLLVTDRGYLAAQGLSPEVVRGVIGLSAGTYDMRIQFHNPALPDLTDVFGDLEQFWNASPLKYVDGAQPPFLVLYGSNDMPGFAQDSAAFYQALVDHGSQAELHMIPGRNHQMTIGDAARPGDPARDFILRFIAEQVRTPGPRGPFTVPAATNRLTAGEPVAPGGMQVAFLQRDANFTEVLDFLSVSNTLGFGAAQPPNYQESSQMFQVLIDDTVVGTFTPSGTDHAVYTTDKFQVTTATHTLTLRGLNPDGGDNTALIDQVFLERHAGPQ
jgi:acetyl esterase/lipase